MKKPFAAFALACFALLLSACSRSTSEEQARAIKNNLSQYYMAGQQYLLESGKPEARYPDLVGEKKYITALKSANGERYEALVVTIGTRSLSVTASDGREVTFDTQ